MTETDKFLFPSPAIAESARKAARSGTPIDKLTQDKETIAVSRAYFDFLKGRVAEQIQAVVPEQGETFDFRKIEKFSFPSPAIAELAKRAAQSGTPIDRLTQDEETIAVSRAYFDFLKGGVAKQIQAVVPETQER